MAAGREYIREAYSAILHNDFVKAIKYFKLAIECEPNNASYHYKLSITYARSNKITEAIEEAETAVRLRPDLVLYRHHLQQLKSRYLTYLAFGRMEQGERGDDLVHILEDAVSLNPLNMEARLLLAVVFNESGNEKKAIKTLKEILWLDPHHQEAKKYLYQLYNGFY